MPVTPTVALVTGAYTPEISSGGQQCRDVAKALAGRVCFHVITTAVDPALPDEEVIEGVAVHRVRIDVRSRASRLRAAVRLLSVLWALRGQVQVFHLHGVSSKNVLITWFARRFGIRVVVTLHTAGQDEPAAVRARSESEYRSLLAADRVLSISPRLSAKYREGGLDPARLIQTFNGIDTERFRPASAEERLSLCGELGLPPGPVVLFVGFFSRDKRPDVLCEAWMRTVARTGTNASLVCVGATSSPYFEIDPRIAERMRSDAEANGLGDRLRFVPPTRVIEHYFRAATLYVLPSVREAMPMALLEAMSCGLPCIATRLPGATDVMIEDGRNGRLVEPDAPEALAEALGAWLANPEAAARCGREARITIETRYAIARAADEWEQVYRQVLTA